MPLARYLQYVNWFNQGDPRYLDFYHPDVVLELGNATINSATGIRDFYREVHAHIHEKVEVSHYVADATGIAAELPSEFKVYKDWAEPNYFRRALKAGEVFRIISSGHVPGRERQVPPHQGSALQAGQRLEDGGLISEP